MSYCVYVQVNRERTGLSLRKVSDPQDKFLRSLKQFCDFNTHPASPPALGSLHTPHTCAVLQYTCGDNMCI